VKAGTVVGSCVVCTAMQSCRTRVNSSSNLLNSAYAIVQCVVHAIRGCCGLSNAYKIVFRCCLVLSRLDYVKLSWLDV